MNKIALRQTVTDGLLLGATAFFGALLVVMFATGAPGAAIWAGVYVVILAAAALFTYRWNLGTLRDRAQRDAQRAAEQHEYDLRMERLAQEVDIIRAGGDEAEVIRARWDLERQERDAVEREQRQARIAAYEAQRADDGGTVAA